MNRPRLSVVIPVFNSVRTLPKCLRSIFRHGVETEVVAVDDGSTDGSVALLEGFAARHSARITIVRQEHCGPGTARNRGFLAATGEYVWFVDSDDWIAPGAAGSLCDAMDATGADIVCFNRKIVPDRRWFVWMRRVSAGSLDLREMPKIEAVWESGPVIYTKIFRREFLADTGVSFPDMFGEDNLETPRIVLRARKIFAAKAVCYACRRGHVGRSSTGGVSDYAARTVGAMYAGFDEMIRSASAEDRPIWNALKAKTAEYMLKSANRNLSESIGNAGNACVLRDASARALAESWPQGGKVALPCR